MFVRTLGYWLTTLSIETESMSLLVDAEASISVEPGARKPHAGICAGFSGNW